MNSPLRLAHGCALKIPSICFDAAQLEHFCFSTCSEEINPTSTSSPAGGSSTVSAAGSNEGDMAAAAQKMMSENPGG